MEIVERYVAVWNEPDAEARRRTVEALWTEAGVEFVEGTQFRGHDGLEARVAEAYKEFVESGRFCVTSAGDVTTHGDIIMFTIQLEADDEIAWAARVFLKLGSDGRIEEDYHLTVKPL